MVEKDRNIESDAKAIADRDTRIAQLKEAADCIPEFQAEIARQVKVIAVLRKALEFYADPAAWKTKYDPHNDIQIPDFYSETSFGDTAIVALELTNEQTAEAKP